MNTSIRTKHKPVFVSVILLLTIVACGAEEDVVKAPSPTPNVTIEILGSTHPEVREIRIEAIQQNNCGGTAEVESQIQKSKSIAHTIEVGAGLEVNANGQVGFAGTDVELGATVASQLGYSYGSVESISRSITLKAKEGTYMEHQVKLQEVWEIGTAKVVVNGQELEVPFSFRTDFTIDLIDSKEIKGKCKPTDIPTATNTLAPAKIPTHTPLPTYTALPTYTPYPPQAAVTPIVKIVTATPLLSPTESANTPPGSVLEVGEWWKEDGVWMKADYEVSDKGRLYIYLELWNKTGNTLMFDWRASRDFLLTDNTNHRYEFKEEWANPQKEVFEVNERRELPSYLYWFTATTSDDHFFDASVTDMHFTVVELSHISNATWHISLPK